MDSTVTDAPGALARSRAFGRAALQSEIRRAYAVIVMLLVIVGPTAILAAATPVAENLKFVGVSAALALLAVQIGVIAYARRAAQRDRGIANWFAICTTVIEASIPTAAIFAHIRLGTVPPHAALVAPPVLGYCLLICLSTLRLRPALCLLGGAVSVAELVALVLYVRYGMGLVRPTTGLPVVAYVMAPVLIFACAGAAAWVAGEIRGHVEAALDEAETKRRMEQIERDLTLARSFQQAMLPRTTPRIPGFDIAGWNRPADQTGGDYYDWQAAPDGHWVITLADVAGHGIGPALATSACRAYVRAGSSHHADLGELTTHTNRLLSCDLPDGRFVTMATVRIDPRGGPLSVLSAGHGPIVLFIGATGEVRDLRPSHPPLAIDPELAYGPAESVTLGTGDLLALVTDGFSEWSRTGTGRKREEFGLARLLEAIRSNAALPAAELIAAVAASVQEFAGSEPQQDDLTMVVIRRTE